MDFVNDIKIKKAGLTITDANDNNVISLSNDGTAEFYGGVTASELEVTSNATFKRDAIFKGYIKASEIETIGKFKGTVGEFSSNLTVNGNVTIGTGTSSTELTTINTNVRVINASTNINANSLVINASEVHNNLATFNKGITASEIIVNGKSTLKGATTLNGAITTGAGIVTVNGETTFTKGVRFNGDTNFNNVSETNTYISNALINDGTSTFNGTAEFNKAVEFNNNVTIGTGTSSTELTTINTNVLVINATEVHNNLARFNKGIEVSEIIVNGKSLLTGAITTATEIVTVNGETIFTRGVTVSELDAKYLDVKYHSTFNSANFTGSVEIRESGRLDAADVRVTELYAKGATFKGATFDGASIYNGIISASEVNVSNGGGKITADNGNFSSITVSSSEIHDGGVIFNGGTNFNNESAFNGETTFNDKATFNGAEYHTAPVSFSHSVSISGEDAGLYIDSGGAFVVGDNTEFVVDKNGYTKIRGTEFTADAYGIAIGHALAVGTSTDRQTLETGTISAVSLIANEIDVDLVTSATGYKMAESEFYAGPDGVDINVPLTVRTTELHTGQATFSGDVNFETKPILGGDIEEVFITKSDLDTYVDIESDQTVTGDKIFTGSTVVEEIEITGNAVFSGNTTFEEIEITGNATFGGETTIEELDVNTINGNSSGLTVNLDGANYIQPIDTGGAELTISVTELHTAQTTFAGTTKFTNLVKMNGASITELDVKTINGNSSGLTINLDGTNYIQATDSTSAGLTISVTELHADRVRFNSYVYFSNQIPELESPASTTKPTGNELVSANWVSEFIYESKPKTIKANIPAIAAAGTYWTGVIDIGSYPIVQVVDKSTNKVSYVDLTISEVSAENETYCIGITPGRAVTANEFMYIVK